MTGGGGGGGSRSSESVGQHQHSRSTRTPKQRHHHKAPEIVLLERLVWVKYMGQWWPALLYHSYTELQQHLYNELDTVLKAQFAMAIMRQLQEKRQIEVARLLGREILEVIEVEEDCYCEFYWQLPNVLPKATRLSRYRGDTQLFLDFHKALDQVEDIIRGMSQEHFALVPTADQSTWYDRAQHVLESGSDDMSTINATTTTTMTTTQSKKHQHQSSRRHNSHDRTTARNKPVQLEDDEEHNGTKEEEDDFLPSTNVPPGVSTSRASLPAQSPTRDVQQVVEAPSKSSTIDTNEVDGVWNSVMSSIASSFDMGSKAEERRKQNKRLDQATTPTVVSEEVTGSVAERKYEHAKHTNHIPYQLPGAVPPSSTGISTAMVSTKTERRDNRATSRPVIPVETVTSDQGGDDTASKTSKASRSSRKSSGSRASSTILNRLRLPKHNKTTKASVGASIASTGSNSRRSSVKNRNDEASRSSRSGRHHRHRRDGGTSDHREDEGFAGRDHHDDTRGVISSPAMMVQESREPMTTTTGSRSGTNRNRSPAQEVLPGLSTEDMSLPSAQEIMMGVVNTMANSRQGGGSSQNRDVNGTIHRRDANVQTSSGYSLESSSIALKNNSPVGAEISVLSPHLKNNKKNRDNGTDKGLSNLSFWQRWTTCHAGEGDTDSL